MIFLNFYVAIDITNIYKQSIYSALQFILRDFWLECPDLLAILLQDRNFFSPRASKKKVRIFFQDYGKGYKSELKRTPDMGNEVLFCGENQKLKFPISDSVKTATDSIYNLV